MFANQSSRRAFLRGAGTLAIGLPISDFFLENGAICQLNDNTTLPKRLITYSFSNGCDPEFWNYDIALSPLKDLKNNICLLQGISNPVSEKAGADAHNQGAVGLFVGQPMGSPFSSGGISLDQFVSEKIDQGTPLGQPLVLGVWKGFAGGQERPVTWYRRSWLANGQPAEVINNPVDAFRKLFSNQSSEDFKLRNSILDTVMDQFRDMTSERAPYSRLNKSRLKDHFESIRSLEEKVQKFASRNDENKACYKDLTPPPLRNKDHRGLLPYDSFSDAIDNHIEMVAYAFKCGLTNTASITFNSAGEEYILPSISSFYSEHSTSHYATENEKQIFISFRKFHMSKIKKIIETLQKFKVDDNESLLDTTVILVGSEFGESRFHIRSPQPFLIAGGKRLGIKVDQILDCKGKKTANDVYRTVLNGLGIPSNYFGQLEFNTGQIKEILRT